MPLRHNVHPITLPILLYDENSLISLFKKYMSQHQKVYFRTCRLKTGLTQKDVAFLAGCGCHQISKVERRHRNPSLRLMMYCRSIFGSNVVYLMPGMVSEVESSVRKRAQVLLREVKKQKRTQMNITRINSLKRILT